MEIAFTVMGNNPSFDEFKHLETRINAILPPRYADCFEDVAPTSMGSATLRYDREGKVAWGEIWTTFCHLALAGGPPHRGRFLGATTVEEVDASPIQYEAVVAELKRAMKLCVDLDLVPTAPKGWIGLQCDTEATSAWLVRAIIAENVIARCEGSRLYVPAGPHFRVEKEIKNVVVCVAKTCHYLFDHLEPEQQPQGMPPVFVCPPLPHEIAAAGDHYKHAANSLQRRIVEATALPTRLGESPGWIGIECGDEETAVWMLRAVAVEAILVRREDSILYVPVDLASDGAMVAKTADAVSNAHRLCQLRTK
jgi:sirohydrochlorin cobaltochelatase